jgi:hypothetical protein
MHDPIVNSIVAKHRRRLVYVSDTMRVLGSTSQETHNELVLEEMREELLQYSILRR